MTSRRWILFFGAILFVLLGGLFALNLLGGGILFELATNTVTSRPAPWEPPRLFGIPYRLVNT